MLKKYYFAMFQLCNGVGTCECGVCICNASSSYKGPTCEECPVSYSYSSRTEEYPDMCLNLYQNHELARMIIIYTMYNGP